MKSETPTHDSASAAPSATEHRDTQRDALRDLVALCNDCAAAETRIEQAEVDQIRLAEKQLHQTLEDIDEHYQSRQKQISAEYDTKTAGVNDEYNRAMADLAGFDSDTHRKLDYETESAVAELKGQIQHAAWLAESVHEGTQIQVARDYAKAKEEHAQRLKEVEDLDNQAASLLSHYGQMQLVTTAQVSPQSDSGDYAPLLERAKKSLAELEHLQIARLFVGVWPFIIFVLVCALSVAVAQLIAGGIPQDWNSITPQWKPDGFALGGAVAVCAITGILLRMLSRAQVRRVYVPLRQALVDAGHAANLMREQARTTRDARLAAAAKALDDEIHAARNKYAPQQVHMSRKRAAVTSSVEAEIAKRAAAIEMKQTADRDAVEAWHTRSLEESRQTRERDTAGAHASREQAIASAKQTRAASHADLENRWNQGLAVIQKPIEQNIAAAGNGQSLEKWDDPRWKTWTPPKTFRQRIRFGNFQVDLKQITEAYPRQLPMPQSFSVPAMLTFPGAASILINTDHAGRAQAVRTLQMVMARLLTQLPAGRVRFTIIDPVGLGQNFAGFMHLADHDEALVGSRIWTESEHIEQQLTNLTEHMETVIQKYLRNEFATIDDYNAQAGELAEPYRYLVIADFPIAFEGESYRRLNSIASSGARCGVFTLIVRDTRKGLPSGVHLDELESRGINLIRKEDGFSWNDPTLTRFPLILDAPPGEESLTQILELVGQKAKESKRVEVAFEAIAPREQQLWTGDSKDDLQVPIGRLGATRLQSLRLGRGVAQHALIAGKTGSGKSTLLHVLVTNLALWYAPDQVEFYLVDFKKGVEFKTYATHALPHARAIAVESDREFGLSVLQRIDAELTRRGELYRKLGVQDLAAYREAWKKDANQLPPLPRTLLMIDEFQEFFSEDDKLAQEASLLLDRLVRQGRAFGIHVLLGSQTIGGASGLARSTLGQMAVRIALQTSEADSQLILGDTNSAARLLSRPGEAIYNDAGGLVEGNSPFQISWLPDEQREVYLDRVRAKAEESKLAFAEPIVFEGNAPADITRNKRLAALIETKAQAQTPSAPLIWLGDPVAIKEPTAITLRLQSGSNVLIIGQHEESAMALISSAMISLAAQHAPETARFYLLDGTPADSSLAGTLPRVAQSLPVDIRLVEWRAIPETIAEIAQEVETRRAAEHKSPLSIYLLIYGLQRYRMLRKSEDTFGGFGASDEEKKPQPDKLLADILREGPALGVHVISWIDTAASIERTFDRGALREFDHRVLFQMSAADSSNLIDSPQANKLGFHRALSYSEELGTMEKFRPYALPGRQWLESVRSSLTRS